MLAGASAECEGLVNLRKSLEFAENHVISTIPVVLFPAMPVGIGLYKGNIPTRNIFMMPTRTHNVIIFLNTEYSNLNLRKRC